jgi:hypothetical protein
MTQKQIKRIFLLLSIILFAASLTQKCYCTTGVCGDSIAAFIFGFFGLAYPLATWTWLANPLLLGAWIFIFRGPKISFILSLSSTLIAASFLLFDQIIDNENGQYKQIISYEAGYWLWLSSHVCLLMVNVWVRRSASLSSTI